MSSDEGQGTVQQVAGVTDLADRAVRVREQVSAAAQVAGRSPDTITIVAVSKTVEREVVDAAVALGFCHFGENRVQDAMRKFAMPLPSDCSLHLIGHLQSNKAKPAALLFDVIESVDRTSVIDALEKEAERRNKPLRVLLQVNIAREAQKAGCDPEEAAPLMQRLVTSPWFEPRGLMTMAPLVDDPEDVRPVFRGLRELRDRLQRQYTQVDLATLSMGMSNDYPVAIAEGATLVRIGRAIFGS